jgi:hypothetical protein
MTVTTRGITAASGLAAVAAGAIFIGVQIGHPHLDATSIRTTELAVRSTAKLIMAALALVGIAGMYLSQVRRNGWLGLVGFVVLAIGYLCIVGTAFTSAFVLPTVAASDPAYVDDMIGAATGGSPIGHIGAYAVVVKIQDFGYLLGGLVFGVALFRARVLWRWACLLLAAGGVVTVILSLLPDAFYRLLAFPNGIAMIGLGISLWLGQRASAGETVSPPAHVAPAARVLP